MNNLLILGAGVEKTKGIDMPLANELVPKIRDFLYEDKTGKEVDKKLRDIIKGLRFSYDDFVKKAVDKLASEFRQEVNKILENVDKTLKNESLTEEQKNLGEIIKAFLSKIKELQKNVVLDEETAILIKNTFPEIEITDEEIVDLGKLSFSDTFEIVMKKILERSIKEPNHPILKHVYRNLMDFENLLLKHFIGFYNDNLNDIKKYLYISWTLWAYLVWQEKNVFSQKKSEIPFYANLKNKYEVITFNYTHFASKYFPKAKYFHGNLQKYIRLDNRNELAIDDYENFDLLKFFDDIFIKNIDFEKNIYIIPSIVPPLKIKPVLSNEYIKTWYDSFELINNANKIVIIGYSFNYADEHFNDLIRKNHNGKQIYVIDPDSENIIKNLQRIFSYRKDDYTKGKLQKRDTWTAGNLTIINSYASDIDINELVGE